MREPLRFSGVMPANILPFKADLSIDEPAYRRHLRWLADTRGVTGIVANGHASEVSSLDRRGAPALAGHRARRGRRAVPGDRRRLLRRHRRGGGAGARRQGGRRGRHSALPADAVHVGRPGQARHGHPPLLARSPAVGLPIIVFEYPPASGIGYAPETLARLAEIPQVAGVKDWSNEIVAFERNLRALRATGRPVAMLSAFTMSLMATFLLGADGAISGMGSVTADLQAELFEACGKGDLDGARRINDRLDPLVRVFYAPPFVDMHNRMKEALVLLGRIPAAHVRPPLTPVSASEREAIRQALIASGLLGARTRRCWQSARSRTVGTATSRRGRTSTFVGQLVVRSLQGVPPMT